MTSKEINEYLAENMFGLIRQKDFGEWSEHDWQRRSDEVPWFIWKVIPDKENNIEGIQYTEEERKALQQTYTEENEKTRHESEIDTFGYSSGYCNGPACRRCDHSFCMHCTDDYDTKIKAGPCTVDAPNYTKNYEVVVKKLLKNGQDSVISFGTNENYTVTYTDMYLGSLTGYADTIGEAVCLCAIEYLKRKKI